MCELIRLTGNAVLVGKCLELTLSPSVKDPVPNAGPGLLSILLSLIPVSLDLLNKTVLGGFSLADGLGSTGLQEGAQVGAVPALVGGDDIVVPVLLDEILEVLAISRGWVGDVVVREPALKLGLMPFIIDWKTSLSAFHGDFK